MTTDNRRRDRNLGRFIGIAAAAALMPAYAAGVDSAKAMNSFKGLVSACQAAMKGQTTVSDYYKRGWDKRVYTPGKVVSFDVQVTNSLVAPLVGVIVVEQMLVSGNAQTEQEATAWLDLEDAAALMTYEYRLAYQDEAWTLAPGAKSTKYSRRAARGQAFVPANYGTIEISREDLLRQPSEVGACYLAMGGK